MGTQNLQVGMVGAGYFAQLHHDAWQRCPYTDLVAITDKDPAANTPKNVANYESLDAMLCHHEIDILDIATPPESHFSLISQAIDRNVKRIICQKPFCQSRDQAQALIAKATQAGADIVIHENFRHQPWHRHLQSLIASQTFGAIYSYRFALRPGDGRGADAYLARQPYFQKMPRFLVRETAVHLLDVFCFFFGKPKSLYADLRRLNPHITGEDAGLIIVEHDHDIRCVFDGNRLSDHEAENGRLTMGEAWLDTEAGIVSLTGDGALRLRAHHSTRSELLLPAYQCSDIASDFGGDCVYHTCSHIAQAWAENQIPENQATVYLEIMDLVEAAYQSAESGKRILV